MWPQSYKDLSVFILTTFFQIYVLWINLAKQKWYYKLIKHVGSSPYLRYLVMVWLRQDF
jgi:hypothetical protein